MAPIRHRALVGPTRVAHEDETCELGAIVAYLSRSCMAAEWAVGPTGASDLATPGGRGRAGRGAENKHTALPNLPDARSPGLACGRSAPCRRMSQGSVLAAVDRASVDKHRARLHLHQSNSNT